MNDNEKKGLLWQKELTRRELLKAGAVGGLAALAASCAPQAAPTATPRPAAQPTATKVPPTPTVVKKPTTLTVGIGGDAPGMNVMEETVSPASSMYQVLWESAGMVEFDGHSRRTGVRPLWVTDWRVLDDKLTWEFKIREGMKFHNGEVLDAEAVAWCLNYVLVESETAHTSFRSTFQAPFDGVEVIDKHTFHFKLNVPFASTVPMFLSYMTHLAPPAYYQEVGVGGYSEKPVGMGPYKFVEWQKGQHIILEKNPDHWRADEFKIDRLIFKPNAEDATRMAALLANEVDIVFNVPPDDVPRLTGSGFEIAWGPIGQMMHLTEKTGSNPGHPIVGPINDVRIRHALNYAIDKDALVNDIMGGYTTKAQGQILGPDCFGFNPKVEAFDYNPEKAKDLMAEAGYPNGFEMDFDTAQGRYIKQKEVSEWLVGEYAKVGIKLNMHLYEWSAMINKVYSDQSAPVFYTGRNWYPHMDPEGCLKMFDCSERRAQMCEEEYEELQAAQRAEFDPVEREKIIQRQMVWLREYAPAVYLFQAPGIFGVSKQVKGFTPTPDDRIHFEGITVETA